MTMHLESGCSVSAIAKGQSVDNTMGFTPLEGLMMGSRSGDVDPSLIPFLIREEQMEMGAVMTLLNKKSGLLGISGKSLDTRVLMKDYDQDPRVKLAMEMFSYRVMKAVGAYLCALGGADAIVFGGGIARTRHSSGSVCVHRYAGAEWKWTPKRIERSLTSRENSQLAALRSRPSSFSPKKGCKSHMNAVRHRDWHHMALSVLCNPPVVSAL